MKAVFEKVPADPRSEITAFYYDQDDFDAPWHYHPECELTYIVEGQGLRYVGNHISAFAEKDLVLLRGNLPHFWKKTSPSVRARSYVIQWNEEMIPDILDLHGIHKCIKNASRGLRFSSPSSTQIIPLMEALILRGENSFIKLLEILQILAAETNVEKLAGASYASTLTLESQDRMNLIFTFISENYGRKISLQEMANLCHLTEPSFSRFFSQNFQKPFTSYLNEYRISQASHMLIETAVPIAHIAYASGYESLSFFYTQFKKYKEISPMGYRKKYGKAIH